MRLRLLSPLLLGLTLTAALAPTTDAHACGGCFHPPVISQGQATVVTGHRMAFTTSPTQSVLWDQIQYAGDPAEFAWVLPVHAGAILEVSNDAWFETLDAATTAQIQSPVYQCPEITAPRSGCGSVSLSAAYEDGAGSGGASAHADVQIVHQGTVGPYETVTLASTKPGALNAWLTAHNYNVDPDIQPIIDAYVVEGFDFIALRLLPGKNVREMKPVRVVTPGAGMTLPLRMVAAGTGNNVAITLFAITEGRLEADKYQNTVVPASMLVWDFQSQSSNFSLLRSLVLASNGGKTWITAYAQPGALLSPVENPYTGIPSYGATDGALGDTLIDTVGAAYVNQGQANGNTTDTSCVPVLQQIASSGQMVINPCPPGVGPNDPSCGEVAPDAIDARSLACGPLDDLAVAFNGLHPADVWLTRLEANLPRSALANDLTLTPASLQTPVSNWMQAPTGVHTEGLCPTSVPPLSMIAPGYGQTAGSGHRLDGSAAFGYAILGLLITGTLARRRRRP